MNKLDFNNISNDEWNFLYWNKRHKGYTSDEANKEINKVKKYLKEKMVKLRKNKKLTPEEINERFKEEFHKLCQMY